MSKTRDKTPYAELLEECGGDRARLALRHVRPIAQLASKWGYGSDQLPAAARALRKRLGHHWTDADPLFRRCLLAVLRRELRCGLPSAKRRRFGATLPRRRPVAEGGAK